jgi:hypothetical protein
MALPVTAGSDCSFFFALGKYDEKLQARVAGALGRSYCCCLLLLLHGKRRRQHHQAKERPTTCIQNTIFVLFSEEGFTP